MAQMMFNPAAFTAQAAKPMPVILVLDNSGSMSGSKIDTLNDAVRNMLETFKQSGCAEVAFRIAIVTFGTGIHLLQEMIDVSQVDWQNIPISDLSSCDNFTGIWDDASARGTPLGAVLKIIKKMIDDKAIIPSRAYRPAIIIVSDGRPTDSWTAAMEDFINNGRSSKCDRWAMSIGHDADNGPLQKFIDGCTYPDDTPKKLCYAGDAKALRDNFKFITMTITNTAAIASKSKVLTVKPVTVKPTTIDAGQQPPMKQKTKSAKVEPQKGDDGGGFEW